MMLRIAAAVILSQIWQIAFSQEKPCSHKVEGKVFDITTNQPIPFVTVRLENTDRGVVADENGAFEIKDICQSEFNLIFTHVGYKKAVHHHDAHHDSPTIFLATDEQILESIVVEGEAQRNDIQSGTVSRITSEELHALESESFGEVAGSISGVNMLSTGQNIVKPIIHGVHSNRVLVINNGVRHEFQNWGAEHAPEIDPSLIDELEVIKGAATVRYGPDALGGVILINPPPLELASHLHGELRLTGKSNGRSGEGTAKLVKGYNRISILGEASWLKQGDLSAPDYNLSNTGKKEVSLATGFRYHLQNFDFEVYYSHFNQELGILRGAVNGNLIDLQNAIESSVPPDTRSFTYDINNPRQKVTHDLIKLKSVFTGTDHSVVLQYGYQANNRQEFDVRRGTNNQLPNIDLDLKTHSFDVDWNHPSFGNWSGVIGLQNQFQDNDNISGTNTPVFIPNYALYRVGFFVIESIEKGMSLYEAGVRYDYQYSSISGRERNNDIFRNSLTFQNITATVGLKRKINGNTTFRSNFGTAWRPPNVSELYSFGRHQASIEYGLWRYRFDESGSILTDQVLTENQRNVKSEAGIKWINTFTMSRQGLEYEITGYVNFIRNFIFTGPAGVTNTVRGAFPFFLYDQGNAIFWGLDWSSRHKLSTRLSADIKSSFLWSKQTDGELFVGQPPANASLDLNYQLSLPAFDQTLLTLGMDYTFKQFQAPRVISIDEIIAATEDGANFFGEDDSNFDILEEPEGYFLTHFTWNSTFKKFELSVSIKNLFNVNYRSYTNRLRYFADESGRNFVFSFSYRL